MDRGMIKWKPFNTLLNSNDIKEIELNRSKISKPIIMEDRINEINSILVNAYNNHLSIKVKHYNNGFLFYKSGFIKSINAYEKYILMDNIRIYFKNIINVSYL